MTDDTFDLVTVHGHDAIRCHLCGLTSHLASDIAHTYCGRCHLFHDVVAQARILVAHGGTHDCSEWRTGRGQCAVCGRTLTDPADAQMVADVAAELAQHAPLTLVLRPESAFHLAALLQLALRHPHLSDGNRLVAVTFLEHVRGYFAAAPATLDVLRRGDDPNEDVTT